MDEISQLLDRAVLGTLDATEAPPLTVIRHRSHRRTVTRRLASATLVIAMTVGGVIGLAGTGRASETTGHLAVAPAAAPAGHPVISR